MEIAKSLGENYLTVIEKFSGMSKEQIVKLAKESEHAISRNPISIACNIAVLTEYLKELKSILTKYILDQIEVQETKSVHLGEFIITKVDGRKSYDFSKCSYWTELDREKKRIEKLMKASSSAVKDKKSGRRIPPAKEKVSAPYYKVQIPKEN